MAHRVHLPAPALRQFIRYYVTVEQQLASNTLIQPIAARSTPLLDFQFGDRCEVLVQDHAKSRVAYPVALVGAQTFGRVQLVSRGNVDSFVVIFQPGGLFKLLSVPLHSLTDQDYEGRSVIGPGVDELADQLAASRSSAERVRISDKYFLERCQNPCCSRDISALAGRLRMHPGSLKVVDLAREAGLSTRQLERRFLEQIGMSPRMFARVARFEAALRLKRETPGLRWTHIAHELGFHDQMHMLRDFRKLSGATPSSAAITLDPLVKDEIDGTRPG
jgi:AraC-like DNA-binding protein